MQTFAKREYVRNAYLMLAYRTLCCQHCGADDQTVAGAHSNWSIHGKGKSIKADDNRCAALCFNCHSALDQGSRLTEHERRQMWHDAHVKTVRSLVILKRWPGNVKVPDLAYPEEWS